MFWPELEIDNESDNSDVMVQLILISLLGSKV